MQFEPLKDYNGWKSDRVFFKHYLVETEQLKIRAVAAGKIVGLAEEFNSDSE